MERSVRGWQAATIAAIVIAVAALGLAIVALNRPRTTTTQRSSAKFAALSGEVRSVKAELATARGETSNATAELAKTKGTLSRIATCLPELTGEINGLTAEVAGGSVFLSQHNQVSSYCSSMLEKR